MYATSIRAIGSLTLVILAASVSALTPPPDRQLTDIMRAQGDAWLAVVDGRTPKGVWRKAGEGPWQQVLAIDATSSLQRVKPGTWRLRTLDGAAISTNDGLTWTATTAPWLDAASDDRGHLFLCRSGRFQRSDDAGVSWSDMAVWGSSGSPANCHATAAAGRLAVVGVWAPPAPGVAAPVQILVSMDAGLHCTRRATPADGALLEVLSKPDALLIDGAANLLLVREGVDIAPDGRLSNRRAWFVLPASGNRWKTVERARATGELLSAVGGDAYGLHVDCEWKADRTVGSTLCRLSADGDTRGVGAGPVRPIVPDAARWRRVAGADAELSGRGANRCRSADFMVRSARPAMACPVHCGPAHPRALSHDLPRVSGPAARGSPCRQEPRFGCVCYRVRSPGDRMTPHTAHMLADGSALR